MVVGRIIRGGCRMLESGRLGRGTQAQWSPRGQCIHRLSVERDSAESQSQQYRWLALTPDLLRLVLRTQPRSWPTAKFTNNLWMPPPRKEHSENSCCHCPLIH